MFRPNRIKIFGDSWLWALTAWTGLLGTLLSVVYYVSGLWNWVIAVSVILLAGVIYVTRPPLQISVPKVNKPDWLWGGTILILEAILLATLYTHRTHGVLNSPWRALPIWFFGVYFVAMLATLAAPWFMRSRALAYATTALHLFSTYGVTIIMHPLGFGFDGFIHRATEDWIAAHGFILPKQPIYIGQYTLVVWLAKLTSLPLHLIDIWFVPIAAALALPALFQRLFTRVWNFPAALALNLTWLYPALYFLWLGLTTPYNFLLLIITAAVCALLEWQKGTISALVPISLGLLGLFTHIMLGAPLMFVIAVAMLGHRWKSGAQTSLLIMYAVAAVLIVPGLFTVYLLLKGLPWPDFVNPLTKIPHFLELYALPFWYNPNAPRVWNYFYKLEWVFAPLVTALAVIGWWFESLKKFGRWLFPLTAVAFVGAAILLRTWIVFPDVGSFEQGDYPLRLLRASLLWILPWAGAGIGVLYFAIKKTKFSTAILSIAMVCAALGLTIAFYFSYPQHNKKVNFPGFNVTSADIKAVQWIDADNNHTTDINYIVLANPIVGVAALSEFSFAKYFDTPLGQYSYYSIPSGSPLFDLYTDMWRNPSQATMRTAMDLFGVDKAYFVINSYWVNYNQIVAAAKTTTDNWTSIENGQIHIFEYEK